MTTALLHDELLRTHDPGAGHPERPARLVAAWEALVESGLTESCPVLPAGDASFELLGHAHDAALLEQVRVLAEAGGGQIDADTHVSPTSWDVARRAAGCGVAAVDAVLGGTADNAFCVIRPPGHHATPDRAMGFCLVNNIAVAAEHGRTAHGLERILIVDFDVHHGNGTQDIFYADAGVHFLSMHRHPFWPGTGAAAETGTRDGLGANRNLPVAYGTPPAAIVAAFGSALHDAAERCRPQLVLLSAGFDAHRDDPIGDLGLGLEHFADLANEVMRCAQAHCDGRMVALLEGGYDTGVLAAAVVQQVRLQCR